MKDCHLKVQDTTRKNMLLPICKRRSLIDKKHSLAYKEMSQNLVLKATFSNMFGAMLSIHMTIQITYSFSYEIVIFISHPVRLVVESFLNFNTQLKMACATSFHFVQRRVLVSIQNVRCILFFLDCEYRWIYCVDMRTIEVKVIITF